jgi:hypothetical protein
MAEAAILNDGVNLFRSTTYSQWDHDKIYGCACDDGYEGYDCAARTCPTGDDPLTTGQQDEVQHIVCQCVGTCSGTWSFTFKGSITTQIAYNANAAAVQTAISALATIRGAVAVAFGVGTEACSAAGETITVTFTTNPGDLPAGSVTSTLTGATSSSLTMNTVQTLKCTCAGTCAGTFHLLYDGETTTAIAFGAATTDIVTALEALAGIATSSMTVAFDAGAVVCAAAEVTTTITFTGLTSGNVPKLASINQLTSDGATPSLAITTNDGTKENEVCSGRGLCDPDAALCNCFTFRPAIWELQCKCTGTCGGYIQLRFDGQLSGNIPYNAAPGDIDTAIEALSNIDVGSITVTMETGAVMCSEAGVTTRITFTGLATGQEEWIEYNFWYFSQLSGTVKSVSIAPVEYNYTASNGAGAAGDYNDCGYPPMQVTHCPFTLQMNNNTAVAENRTCSGHGSCSGKPTFRCTCQVGFTGSDCSLYDCPLGPAWFDEASDTDVAHSAGAVCSNRGTCNHNNGTCTCETGFSGAACTRLNCPTDVKTGIACSGRGTCLSMSQLAEKRHSASGMLNPTTYGATPNTAAAWDADRVFGCYCGRANENLFYNRPSPASVLSYDCSLMGCPYGDDPKTATLEVQTVTCTSGDATFTLSYNNGDGSKPTSTLSFDSTASAVELALEAIGTAGDVSVTYSSGTAACTAGGTNVMSITFMSEWGDLAALSSTTQTGSATITINEVTTGRFPQLFESQTATCTASSGTFTLSFRDQATTAIAYGATLQSVKDALHALSSIYIAEVSFSTGVVACTAGGSNVITVQFKSELGDLPMMTATATTGSVAVLETVKGDKDSEVCSGRGLCDHKTGQCKCFGLFASSDHNGGQGIYRDCGLEHTLALS